MDEITYNRRYRDCIIDTLHGVVSYDRTWQIDFVPLIEYLKISEDSPHRFVFTILE